MSLVSITLRIALATVSGDPAITISKLVDQASSRPANILFTAELKGGDDIEEFYRPEVEWDWDDDTRSESTPDCEPYEPGTSQIRRRFSQRRRFDYGGRYEVRINLKKRGDTVASARTVVELRGGRFGRFD